MVGHWIEDLFSGLSPAAYDGIGTSSSNKYPPHASPPTSGGAGGGNHTHGSLNGHPYSSEKLHHTYPAASRTHSAPLSLASPGFPASPGGLSMGVHGLHGMERGHDISSHHHPSQVALLGSCLMFDIRCQLSDVGHIHCAPYNNDTSSVYLTMPHPPPRSLIHQLHTSSWSPSLPPSHHTHHPSLYHRDHPTSANAKAPRFSVTFLSVWG